MDRFSFDDSIRFEEDSLCSWSSEPESLCNNWRGWKKPAAGSGAGNGGLSGMGGMAVAGGSGAPPFGGAGASGSCTPGGNGTAMANTSTCGRHYGE